MKRRDFLKALTAVTALSCTMPKVAFSSGRKKPTVYFGGPILTMNSSNDIVEALLVESGKIVATGKKEDMLQLAGENRNEYDLKGQTLLPGMIDGHGHFPAAASYDLYYVNLNVPPLGTVTSIEDLQKLLAQKAKETPEGSIIFGVLYNDLGMKEQRNPTREELDEVSTKHPIIIRHVSGHAHVANSLALKIAGITADTKPPNGVIQVKDGKLTGLIEGVAYTLLLTPEMPAITVNQADCIAYDSNSYASKGITVANNGGSPTLDADLIEASHNGSLKIRVTVWPLAHRDDKIISTYKDKRSGAALDKNGKVILGAAKLFADGSPQGYTAHFSKPYYKQMTGKGKDYRGISYFRNPEVRMQRIKDLHNNGWQIATHTNGDQAIEDMINVYGEAIHGNKRNDHRHILNHCQFNRPDQVPRMAELGLIPSYFVTHTYFWGDVHRNFVSGPEMAAHISPCKAALNNDIPIVLHNDTPVTPIDPLMDVYSAVNRLTSSNYLLGPDQRIAVMEALRGVTINAARMYFMEDKVGSLEKGKLADMVILAQNPLEVKPEKIKDIKIVATYVDGEEIYRA